MPWDFPDLPRFMGNKRISCSSVPRRRGLWKDGIDPDSLKPPASATAGPATPSAPQRFLSDEP